MKCNCEDACEAVDGDSTSNMIIVTAEITGFVAADSGNKRAKERTETVDKRIIQLSLHVRLLKKGRHPLLK
jgi:hypothetical protein